MQQTIDPALIDWSRAQFALTAIYHWLFVPLTLGLAVVMGISETIYYRTREAFWKRTTRFWMKLFGINFAIGVATGLILEFEFGTNWSNYSWLVGDVFGAPLAIEGIFAFFMESTFIAVMFFGWDKVSRGAHLAATWLTGFGVTLSAWWILVANAWMQRPVGMSFNPDTVRNEMTDFMAVAFSPVAVNKFLHTILSSWIIGAAFVVAVSAWYLLRRREQRMARVSIRMAAWVGLAGALAAVWTGDKSGYYVARYQPMKLAAMEALMHGQRGADLTAFGVLRYDANGQVDTDDPFVFRVAFPKMLSLLAGRSSDAYVPGVTDLLDGGYLLPDGTPALPAAGKMERGRRAVAALGAYRRTVFGGEPGDTAVQLAELRENLPYFGYGYITDEAELVPDITLNFYAFRVMVGLGVYLLMFFALMLFLSYRRDVAAYRRLLGVAVLTAPLAYLASHAGWVVAETGRQPWAIQDILPVSAAISDLETSSVRTTFFIFLVLFTVLLVAEVSIMLRAVRKGPDDEETTPVKP